MQVEVVIQECAFKAVRSSGAGGQHVNKVSSKIELTFDMENSKGLTDLENYVSVKNYPIKSQKVDCCTCNVPKVEASIKIKNWLLSALLCF